MGQDPAPGTSVAVGSSVSYTVSLGVEEVSVPDLAGPAADAEQALADARLAGAPVEAYSESVPAGEVMAQDPAPGTSVAVGSSVSYTVSLGVEEVSVPDLAGPAADAEQALADARLAGAPVRGLQRERPRGRGHGPGPAPGTSVAVGSSVSYTVSLGVEEVSVPDLAGPAADAEQALADARLAGAPVEAYSESVPAGEVMAQDPAPGTSVAVGSSVSYTVSLGVEEVSVPDLAGPAADAEQALADARLAGAPVEAYSESVPAGEVMAQDPAPGTSVAVGSSVSYTVSLGVEEVSVPDLAGPAADAEQALADARLAGAPVEAYSESVPAGEVMAQDPAPGTSVAVGSSVSYTVSLGVEEVSVPDLAGPAADAEQALADARLAGAPVEAYSESVPAGEVMAQDPAPGTSVAVGSSVSYTVSLGVEEVSVPDLAGPAADAEQALADARLAGAPVEAYSESVPAGEVMAQDPAPGTSVAVGSSVSYTVSLGVEEVSVPDLAGPAADAEQALADARLAGAPVEAYSESVPAGEVMAQDPAPGTSVAVGSSVSYTVSLGVEEVSVPDLAGPAADAEQALADARLAGAPVEAYSESVPAGEVMAQDPPPARAWPWAAASATPSASASKRSACPTSPVPPPTPSRPSPTRASRAPPSRPTARASPRARSWPRTPPPARAWPWAAASATPSASASKRSACPTSPVPPPTPSRPSPTRASRAPPSRPTARASPRARSWPRIPPPARAWPWAAPSATPSASASKRSACPTSPVPPPTPSRPSPTRASRAAPIEAYSDSVPAGEVMSQDPAPARACPWAAPSATASASASKQVSVPDLAGPAADAEQALADARLAGGPAEAYSDSVPAGDVISQDPAPGTSVPVGSTVSYSVSLGVEEVSVPDLAGPAADAEQALADARLAGAPSRGLQRQRPRGRGHEPGSRPRHERARGQHRQLQRQPRRQSRRGRPCRARPARGRRGRRHRGGRSRAWARPSSRPTSKIAAGNAIKTDPAADSRDAPMGSAVVLYVSTGTSTRLVPEVQGLAEAEAVAAIARRRPPGRRDRAALQRQRPRRRRRQDRPRRGQRGRGRLRRHPHPEQGSQAGQRARHRGLPAEGRPGRHRGRRARRR